MTTPTQPAASGDVTQAAKLYVSFSDDGQHIRKWSPREFEGGAEYLRIKPMDAGRFDEWSNADLAGQARMQANDMLDPEYSAFMTAVSARLSTPSGEREREAVALELSLALTNLFLVEAAKAINQAKDLLDLTNIKAWPEWSRSIRNIMDGIGVKLSEIEPTRGMVDAILLALPPAAQAGDGWKLVPVEPTEAMIAAGQKAWGQSRGRDNVATDVWSAMLSAAPTPPKAGPLVAEGDEEWGCDHCRNDGPLNAMGCCPRCDAQYSDDEATQPAPFIPAGMKPWPGGDSAPEDWDGGEVRLRNGSAMFPSKVSLFYHANGTNRWDHHRENRNPNLDIIAYTPLATPQPEASVEVREAVQAEIRSAIGAAGRRHDDAGVKTLQDLSSRIGQRFAALKSGGAK